MKNLNLLVILSGLALFGCASEEVTTTPQAPPERATVQADTTENIQKYFTCGKPEQTQKVDVGGKTAFVLEAESENEEGANGPECHFSQINLTYANPERTKIMNFTPLATLTRDSSFIIDVGGKPSVCGDLLDGSITVYDLGRNQLLIGEILERIPGKSGTLASILNGVGIYGINEGYSPYEHIHVKQIASSARFMIKVDAITGAGDESVGKIAHAEVEADCRESQADCKFKLVSQSEEKKDLRYETCEKMSPF